MHNQVEGALFPGDDTAAGNRASGRGGARPGAGRHPKTELLRLVESIGNGHAKLHLVAANLDLAIKQALCALAAGQVEIAVGILRRAAYPQLSDGATDDRD